MGCGCFIFVEFRRVSGKLQKPHAALGKPARRLRVTRQAAHTVLLNFSCFIGLSMVLWCLTWMLGMHMIGMMYFE